MKPINPLLTLTLLLAAGSTGLCQPVITNQPSSLTNIAGTTATFSVGAAGTEPLHYQWQFYASDLTDKTNASLVLTNVQTGNGGNYSVVVTNVDGAVTSVVATLTVWVPPSIIRQPTNQSATLGATTTTTVLSIYLWQTGVAAGSTAAAFSTTTILTAPLRASLEGRRSTTPSGSPLRLGPTTTTMA